MGDSKLLTKFRRLCDDYKAEFTIEGVVESFDTIYPVPPERLTRGMTLNLGEETRLVDFHLTKKPPVDVGNVVLVVGSNYSSAKNSILPAVILNPTEKWVLFSKELLVKKPDKTELVITLVAAGIFIVALLILREFYSSVAFGFFLVSYFFICAPSYILTYLRRPRLLHCSKREFFLLTEEITARFGSKSND